MTNAAIRSSRDFPAPASRDVPYVLGVLAAGVATAVLLCWVLAPETVSGFARTMPGYAPLLLVLSVLSGLVLAVLERGQVGRGGRGGRLVGMTATAGVLGMLSVAVLAMLTSWQFKVGGWLLAGPPGDVPAPEQVTEEDLLVWLPEVLTLVALVTRRWRLAQGLALALLTVNCYGIQAVLYGIDPAGLHLAYAVALTPVPVINIALAVGMLAAVPGGVFQRVVHGEGPGTLLVRRMFPAVVLGLPMIGLVSRLYWSNRLYRPTSAVSIIVSTSVVTIMASLLRTARAADRADEARHAAEASTARELQRVLLPARLPAVPGIQTAARYVTARGTAVGGDWYDVLPLPRGGVGLVMGDVEGHSITSAAIMGQVRNVLRAYAVEGHRPAELLTHLNQFVSEHTDCLVTCCYLELDPVSRVVTIVTAGHPPPIVLDAGHGGWYLPVHTGLPLGVEPTETYEERTAILAPLSRLILFTDGMVEYPSLFSGPEALLAAAVALGAGTADSMADALTDRSSNRPAPRDDAALLVVHLDVPLSPDEAETVAHTYAPGPAATPAARRFVHDILTGWNLHRLADTAELLTSELVTNAVQHTAGEVRLVIEHAGADAVRICVHDKSDRPAMICDAGPDDIGGRGLIIVDMLADTWGVQPSPGGKAVWFQLSASSDSDSDNDTKAAAAPLN